jgi:NAD(P)-dependent dehydrogenase (short-subunit alcohol dehydrogenase family)
MAEKPQAERPEEKGADRLVGKVALITGADSGIGRAVAIAYAREGADVALAFLNEDRDAQETAAEVSKFGRRCVLLPGDVAKTKVCERHVEKTLKQLGGLDILVNNAAEQHPQESIEDITDEQLERTFATNIFAYFRLTRAALPHMEEGSAIINTTSVTAYRGSPKLLDYSSTKGAIVSFTRSLSKALAERGIRVNGVAPGPVWTPLINSTFPPEKVAKFGTDVPMKRAGEPAEIASAFVFLASIESSYMTGQVLHPNGGEIING